MHGWEDNIKVDLQKVGCEAWPELTWIRVERWQTLVNAVINLQVP
jgi:hypothetical protein